MALSQTSWIETHNGLAFVGDICDFFKAKIANEDEDAETNEESEKAGTHGVWATLRTGESRLVYQGSENKVDALIGGLRKTNNAVDIGYLVPSHIE